MNRRHFFKMLGTVAASAVCAPLMKLLPPKRIEPAFSGGWRIGSIINIRKPGRFLIKQADDDLKAIVGLWQSSLDAEKELRRAALDDLKAAISG